MPGSAAEAGAAGYRPLLFSIAYGMTGSVGDAEDIVQDAFGDGGGKTQAIGKPVAGRQRVAQLVAGLFRRGRPLGIFLRLAWVNGRPGAVIYDAEGLVISVIELDAGPDGDGAGAVQAIHAVVNPDKLGHLGPVSDLARLPGTDDLPARAGVSSAPRSGAAA